MPASPPTSAEIEDLKASWRQDPIWDIEDTEGFESVREELRAYRLEFEAEQDRLQTERVAAKADELGCPGNPALALYVMGLENRLDRLDRDLSDLTARCG